MRCHELQNSLENGGSLSQCHLREVETTYGLGIIELPLPHDLPGYWSRPPMIGRDDAVYAPTINLAQLAIKAADALDRLEGTQRPLWSFRSSRLGPQLPLAPWAASIVVPSKVITRLTST